jgi:hypothetical protein
MWLLVNLKTFKISQIPSAAFIGRCILWNGVQSVITTVRKGTDKKILSTVG